MIDPIVLNDIDESNEWLVGEMGGDEVAAEELVFDDDTLTWGDVANVVGAGEPITYTRQQTKMKKKTTSRPSSSMIRIEEEEEEEMDDVETEEEVEEAYKSSSDESNDDEENLEDQDDDFD